MEGQPLNTGKKRRLGAVSAIGETFVSGLGGIKDMGLDVASYAVDMGSNLAKYGRNFVGKNQPILFGGLGGAVLGYGSIEAIDYASQYAHQAQDVLPAIHIDPYTQAIVTGLVAVYGIGAVRNRKPKSESEQK